MKTLAHTLLIALTISTVSMAGMGKSKSIAHHPARIAHYQMAAYTSADADNLHLSIDKQAGGRVDIRLKDAAGAIYYEQTLSRKEAKVRLKLNLADLKDGVYRLEVSNGAETTVREITIATHEPAQAVRSIELL